VLRRIVVLGNIFQSKNATNVCGFSDEWMCNIGCIIVAVENWHGGTCPIATLSTTNPTFGNVLWNMKVHYCFQKRVPHVPVRAVESEFGARWKFFGPYSGKGWPAENLYTKSERRDSQLQKMQRIRAPGLVPDRPVPVICTGFPSPPSRRH
jgi:hypothetical protein